MSNDNTFDEPQARDLLAHALSLWWLRPENGLALASYCLRGVSLLPEPEERSADFACGDGVNTFFKCGGRFNPSFDVFASAVNSADARGVATGAVDVFDYVDDGYDPDTSRRPQGTFSYGTDHKRNLLEKARRLDFYDETVLADLAADSGIPDASLDSCYCNSLYWVSDPQAGFALMARKVRSGGRMVFDVMTDRRASLDFRTLVPAMPDAWSELMNRGRQDNNPGLRNEAQWDELFQSDGLARIVEKRDIFPTAIAQVWNIGLRPIFPVLNKFSEAVDATVRQELKQEWVQTWLDLLLPVLLQPSRLMADSASIRIQYVLERQ